MQIHHIGYLVTNIKASMEVFINIGYKIKKEIVYDSDREVDICFLENDGILVELVSPRKSSTKFNSLKKRVGNAPYHICYIANDFFSDIGKLERNGYSIIIPPAKADAIEGRKVAFLYHQEIGLIEVLER